MTTLTKGANCPLPSERVVVEVAGGAPLDVGALLCDESGKVRSDADFVFYGAPSGPGVRHRPAGTTPVTSPDGASSDSVEIDLAAVPAAVTKIVVTASLDGSGPPNFSSIPGFSIVVRDAGSGATLAEFRPDGLARETALLCMEVYRRGGAWKLRAVGQGYESGLGGIATHFGVDIAEQAPPAAALPPPPAPPTSPATPPPPAPPPPPAAPPVNLGKLTLDKGAVALEKRQTVSLTKTSGPALHLVRMGLGWDPAAAGKKIDLDASCILVSAKFEVLDLCWFVSKKAGKKSVRHSGDNLTGEGEGDDETIEVDLGSVPRNVHWLVFTVNSYRGHKFTEIRNAYCRLVDGTTGEQLVRFDLTESAPRTAVIMAALRRDGRAWEMTAIGAFTDGKTVRDIRAPAVAALRELSGG